jgi:hypothetical protein
MTPQRCYLRHLRGVLIEDLDQIRLIRVQYFLPPNIPAYILLEY